MKNLRYRSRLSVLSDLSAIEMYLTLVETCSFKQSARLLGVSASTLSKKLYELEQRAGARFLKRSSRTVSVTDAGRRFHDYGRKLLEQAAALEALLCSQETGRLRISAPVVLAERRLAPLLYGFFETYPSVEINLLAASDLASRPEVGIDIALSIRSESEVTDFMHVVAPHPRILCAAPRYLDVAGTPETLDDLAGHDCLVFQMPGRTPSFDVCVNNRSTTVQVSGPLVSDNASIILGAACAGHGIAQLGTHVVERDIVAGRLRQVLPAYDPRPKKIVAVLSESEFASPLAIAFLQHIKAYWPTSPVAH